MSPVTAVKTGWSSGDLVFKKKSDNSTLMSIKASTGDINIPTGVTLTVTDGITGLSLDAAYNAGRTITVDAGTVTLAGAQATANTLTITESTGSGKLIDLTHSGTGTIDIDGTSSTWYITKTGAATFASIASGAITLSAGLDMSASGTGSYDFTLKTNMADALSIKDSAGDLILFKTTTGSQLITITPATTVTGTLTASTGLTVTAGGVTVSGASSVDNTLTVSSGGIAVTGASSVAGALTVSTGGAAITGNVTVTGGLTVTGTLTWGGATTIGESLTVDELILDTDGAALAGTVCGLWRDNAGDASFQAVSGKEIKFLINGTVEAQIGGTETVINEGSGDRNFRVESNGLQYALYVDGGLDCVVVGDNTNISDVDYRLMVGNVAKTLATGEEAAILYVAPTASTTTFTSGTHDYVATAYFKEPNITSGGATLTVASTIYIADAPTEGSANYALYVASGASYLAGALTVTGATVLDGGAFTFNDTSADLDFRVESNGLQYALYVDGGKDCVVIGDNTDVSDIDARLRIGNVAKTLSAGEEASIVWIQPTASTTEAGSGTHDFISSLYVKEPDITHNAGGTLTVAATVYVADAPTEGAANYALYIASGAMYSAGAITINSGALTLTSGNVVLTSGNVDFSAAASDIVFKAATAAALELSDGTTKYYAIDSRVTTVGVTTHALDISDYTLASAAGAVATGLSLAAHTLNLTGNTQVTTQVDTVVLGARTIAGDGIPGAVTVDEANTLLAVAPTEGANAVLTAASAVRILNAGGTPVSQYGLYIEDLTVGATNDVGIYIAGSDTAAIYVAADPVRLADSVTLMLGTGTGLGAGDATLTYNGTNVVLDPAVIGTGVFVVGSGEGGATAGTGTTIRTVDVATGGAGNVNGADLTLAAGLGTGTGTRGTVIIQTPQVAGAGDNPQTLETMMTFGEDITTLKAGAVFQADGATPIGISVNNSALTVGTAGSLCIPYRSSTAGNLDDASAGNVNGCIGLQNDSDAGPVITLEARVEGAWVSVALSGFEIQGKTFGGSKKRGEKWHDKQLLGEGFVDETVCALCGEKMKVEEPVVLYPNFERKSTEGSNNLHCIFAHLDCAK